MTGKTQGSYAATYGYRFGDKLKAVTSSFPGEAPSVGYNYDGLDKRRVEQFGTSSITWFRWLGMEESGEYTGTPGSYTIGAMLTGYVPGLAAFAGADPTTAEWRYPLTDHLGSVRQLTAQNKAALARYDYAPYGELMRSSGLPLTVGYTGHRWDPAIGQYFAPFRYYNPQTARWNMRDPLGFVDGINQYAYVQGKPTIATDPTGAVAWWVTTLGNAITAGVVSALCPSNTWTDVAADLLGGAVGGFLDSLLYMPKPINWARNAGARISRGIQTGFGAGWSATVARAHWKPLANEQGSLSGEITGMALGIGLSTAASFFSTSLSMLHINPFASGLAATAASGSLTCAVNYLRSFFK